VLLLTKPTLAGRPALSQKGKPLQEQPNFRAWTDAFSNMWSILKK
jgi:hypothetical protein